MWDLLTFWIFDSMLSTRGRTLMTWHVICLPRLVLHLVVRCLISSTRCVPVTVLVIQILTIIFAFVRGVQLSGVIMIISTLVMGAVYLLTRAWRPLVIVVWGAARSWTSTRRPSPLLAWSHAIRTAWSWLHVDLLAVIIYLLATLRCMLPIDWRTSCTRRRHWRVMVVHDPQAIVWRHRLRVVILRTSVGPMRKLMMRRWTAGIVRILALDHPRNVLLRAALVSNNLNGSVAKGRKNGLGVRRHLLLLFSIGIMFLSTLVLIIKTSLLLAATLALVDRLLRAAVSDNEWVVIAE